MSAASARSRDGSPVGRDVLHTDSKILFSFVTTFLQDDSRIRLQLKEKYGA